MTCIVALIQDDVTYFAGDSLVVNVPSQYYSGAGQTVRKEPKIWERDSMLFGANGSVRMLQLLRYVLEIPAYDLSQSKIAYLVTTFIPQLQSTLSEAGESREELGGNILLSLGNELFTIGNDFRVCDTAESYDSVGKAHEVAIGSLHTTTQLQLPPLERLTLALKAAERHTCVVSEPFMYITNGMHQAKMLPSYR